MNLPFRVVLLAVIAAVLAFAAAVAWWTWNLTRPLPTDAALTARFREHRADFDSLAMVALADTNLVGAAHDWMSMKLEVYVRDTPRNDRLLTPQDVLATGRSAYRRLLDRAEIPSAARREGAVWLVVGSNRSARKGFLYSEEGPTPLRSTLNGLEKGRQVDPG